jgi:hypothetical protein
MYRVCRDLSIPEDIISLIGSYSGPTHSEITARRKRMVRRFSRAVVNTWTVDHTVVDICRDSPQLFVYVNCEWRIVGRLSWVRYIDLLLEYGRHVIQLGLCFLSGDNDDADTSRASESFDALSTYLTDHGIDRRLLHKITLRLSDDIMEAIKHDI